MEELTAAFIAEWEGPGEYITAHTSGSTGRPKEIRLLKADMAVSAHATCAFFGIGPQSAVGMALSPEYIAGKMMIVRALVSGARLCPLPVSNAIDLGGLPVLDLLAVVPSQLQAFVDRPDYASRVRALLVGGAPPDPDVCATLTALGYNLYISYGMTETCSHVALARGDDPRRVFRAMPGISFESLPGGRLAIVCPAFSFGRVETNDVVELLTPTAFRWRGRADGAINSGGLKFFPEELETLYRPALGTLPFYVCGAPHPKWGTAVALVYEGDAADAPLLRAALASAVADRRSLPALMRAVEALPRTPNGKLRRVWPE